MRMHPFGQPVMHPPQAPLFLKFNALKVMERGKLRLVCARPGVLSGQPALRDDPRVPPETILDNMDAGETADQVIENLGLRTPLADVLAVYAHAQRQRVEHPV